MSRLTRPVPVVAALAVAGALAAGCAGPGARIDYDAERGFGQYETFAWQGSSAKDDASRPVWDNAIFAERVAEAARTVLQERGLEPAPPERANLLVQYGTASRETVQPSSFSIGHSFGHHRGFHGHGHHGVPIRSREEGRLVVDLLDGGDGELVWRGWVSGSVGESSRDAKAVEKAVREILGHFPPDGE